jgi:hypothetical protein
MPSGEKEIREEKEQGEKNNLRREGKARCKKGLGLKGTRGPKRQSNGTFSPLKILPFCQGF